MEQGNRPNKDSSWLRHRRLTLHHGTAPLLPGLSVAYRTGANGPAWEGAIQVHPWGFQLEDIRIPVHN